MTILPILTVPHPILKETSQAVESVDDSIRALFDDMLETMYDANGIGLAAPQVGILKRLLVMDISPMQDNAPSQNKQVYYMANPEIIEKSEETNIYREGCLSVPNQFEDVERPKFATIKYMNYHGEEVIQECDELLATCVQHEIDHLNGIVFIDHISKLKKDMILRKMKKTKKTRLK